MAVDRDLLARVTDRFQAAGVELKGCSVAPLAALQAIHGGIVLAAPLGAMEGRKPCGLLVDLGESGTDLVAWTEKGPVQARTLRRGLRQVGAAVARAFAVDAATAFRLLREQGSCSGDASSGSLETAQTSDGSAIGLVVQQSLEPVLREIEHMRMWLRTELGLEVTSLQLAGGGALLPGLPEWISGSLGVSVVRAEPPARTLALTLRHPAIGAAPTGPATAPNVGTPSLDSGGGWARLLVAAGAALSAHRRPFVRFEAGAHVRTEEGFLVQHFGSLFALGLAIVGLFGVDTILRVRALEREHSNVREELSSVSSRVFGQALEDADAVDGLLASLGEDPTEEEIPARGALEVLEMIAKVAAPRDGTPQAQSAALPAEAPPVDGATAEAGAAGSAQEGGPPPSPSTGAPGESPGGPIPLEAGIVLSDALEFASIDVRAIKIEMKVSATRAGAQDRLALQLESLGCIRNITKGRVVDRNERKVFEMSMDHDCFTKAIQSERDSDGSAT